jgi:hypothetical protein
MTKKEIATITQRAFAKAKSGKLPSRVLSESEKQRIRQLRQWRDRETAEAAVRRQNVA